jgi:molybdopterin-guanine dinucleotide biosynthesis protein A
MSAGYPVSLLRGGFIQRMNNFSIVIQAGGESRRMGQDKALVPFMGKTLIEYILQQIRGMDSEIIIISNRPEHYLRFGYPVYSDVFEGVGALAGLHTAIHYSANAFCLVLGCDMPFVNIRLVEKMLEIAAGWDAVIPQLGERDKFEPFKAVYKKSCLDPIQFEIKAGNRRAISFFDSVRVRYFYREEVEQFDKELLSFYNVNTPEQLIEAEKIANKIDIIG